MKTRFPIVGLGASAGGLDVLISIFTKMPLDTGMAFVLVQHLDPEQKNLTVEIISRVTKIPIEEVKEGTIVKANHIYVIPPNFDMKISKERVLKLSARNRQLAINRSINCFFSSLAIALREYAVGVILSGNGSDGSQGLIAIHNHGGVCYAQDPITAKFQEMPLNTIQTGVVDFVIKPDLFPEELLRISKNLVIGNKTIDLEMAEILNILLKETKVNFADYKQSTIHRRIDRRMVFLAIKSLKDYLDHIRNNPKEVKLLYDDILIKVTSFFRETSSFKELKTKVLPKIILEKSKNQSIRIWVPGCATGEEAYSIAILCEEVIKKLDKHNKIKIFATDISEPALEKARAGIYSDKIIEQLPKRFVENYFDKVDDGYKVHKQIRDMCIFSKHDLTSDPPFAKLDLISCRNVLIYFSGKLQKKLMSIFHYSLQTNGYLWLGKSENPGTFSKLFTAVDKSHKFFRKLKNLNQLSFNFPLKPSFTSEEHYRKDSVMTPTASDFKKDADRLILSKFSPPSVVINSEGEILQFRGRLFPFLEIAPGKPNMNVLKMARPEIFLTLRSLFQEIKSHNKPVEKTGLNFEINNERISFSIEMVTINPIAVSKERSYLIVFKQEKIDLKESFKTSKEKKALKDKATNPRNDIKVQELSKELSQIRDYHQALIEQYETTQEELMTVNEELQSANEEFLSANEEIETAKEELQSTNEELISANEELQIRNSELIVLSNELNNILSSIEIPMVIVGGNHNIRMFSPKAKTIFHLINTDIGRPISDIKTDLDVNISDFINSSSGKDLNEIDLQDINKSWWRLQVRPFRTADNGIDGVVITVLDINLLKINELKDKEIIENVTAISDTVPIPLAVIDEEFHFISANRSFYKYFPSLVIKSNDDMFQILNVKKEDLSKIRNLFRVTNQTCEPFNDFEIEYKHHDLGVRRLLISGGKIEHKSAQKNTLLMSLVDVTDQRNIDEKRLQLLTYEKEARAKSDKANETKDIFLATLSHELRTPLSSILTWAQLISKGKVDFDKAKQGALVIEQNAKIQSQLIDDLLDISKVIAGKLVLEIEPLDLADVIKAAIASVQSLAEKKEILIKEDISHKSFPVLGDKLRMQQIVWNLLTNAIKFSPKGSQIKVELNYLNKKDKSFAEIKVLDQGKGIEPDFLPIIFQRFSQADSSSTRIHGGLGLGLSIVHNLAELQGGNVKAKNSDSGKGAEFVLEFPVFSEQNCGVQKTLNPAVKESGDIDELSLKQQPKLSGIYILLVDDDDSAREAISIYLRSFGAEVMSVNSVSAALESFSARRPDILVSDIAMPGEDGYSLIKKVRVLEKASELEKVPALALTAYATAADIQRAKNAGFDRHLSKPVETNYLGKVILNLAGKEN